jgi:hypothetical protein
MVAEEMQMKGSQAVACALWALCCFWHSPEDAVICSTHLGGYTHSVAAMTGAPAPVGKQANKLTSVCTRAVMCNRSVTGGAHGGSAW